MMSATAVTSCKNWCEHVREYGIEPILLLLRIDSNGLGGMEPVASSMLPHAVSTVGYILTILHPTCHGHTEM